MKKILLSSLLSLAVFSTVSGQRKCLSHDIYQNKLNSNPEFFQERQRINSLIAEQQNNPNAKLAATLYTIPVVVHVIHNGEPIGVGSNISDAQILSQIDVLNQDFRALNSDMLPSNHPFYGNVADAEIEFCLAKQDENGNATTGITRDNAGKDFWEATEIDAGIKPLTAWDRTKYLNIWVVTIGGVDDGTLGYATFPGTNDATDGVVISGIYFGTTGTALAPYNLGRTATHEIGHYFNLYHIWGDATCGDDEVADTEPQEQSSSGCPNFPSNAFSSCGSGANGEMYMNYMDYSDDNCMNMFTAGQKTKMRAAIDANRASLLTSSGCVDPNSVNELVGSKISVYPNPANDKIQVSISKEQIKSVSIFSALGAEVSTTSISQSAGSFVNVSTSNLNSGNYVLRLETNKGVSYQQFMIVK